MDRGNLVWSLAGAAVTAAFLGSIFYFQARHTPASELAYTEKIELSDQLRAAWANATEAEENAVLATTDEASIAFAQQARAALATAEQRRQALGALLAQGASAHEKTALAQLSKAFVDFQKMDAELLDLAVKNTNIKATALAFGPAAEALQALDTALARIVTDSARSSAASAKQAMLAASTADAAALRIQSVLPQHIAEESDEKMSALEARMTRDEDEAKKGLSVLETLVAPTSAELGAAKSSFARYAALKKQIVELSRENTNVRSLSISMHQKRKVTARCQEALAELAKALEESNPTGPRRSPATR